MFRSLRKRKERKVKARALYDAAVMQARLPVFYQDLGVPDSVDGRFEMVALHCYIVIHRLNRVGQEALAQALFDAFFIHMSHSLREMGVGDLGVPKHMQRMMKGFNGRRQAYELAIKNNDLKALNGALVRNVYGTVEAPEEACLSALANYVVRSVQMETTDAEFVAIHRQNQEVLHGKA